MPTSKSLLLNNSARTNEEKAAVLKKTELFANLSDPIVGEVAARTITRQLRPGEILFSEHDKAKALYIVAKRIDDHTFEMTDKIKGKVMDTSTIKVSEDGKTLTVTVHFPGEQKPMTMVYDKAS